MKKKTVRFYDLEGSLERELERELASDYEEYKRPTRRKSSKKKGKRNYQKPVKTSAFSKWLLLLQLLLSLVFLGSVYLLGILPDQYFLALAILLAFFYLLVVIRQKAAVKKRRKRANGKLISLLLIIALSIGTFYVWKVNLAFARIAAGESQDASARSMDLTTQPFQVYISGIDVYGDIDLTSRSDVNIIATVNPNTHKILLTTTPRDYYVTIPGVSGEAKDKLTHAGTYGVATSMATLENLYGTELPFYVRVNFTSVIEIIDLMGGIDVDSECAFTTSKAAGEVVEIQEGSNHLNGKQALAFVRERKALASGDNQRGKNQEALLKAMIEKMVSPAIIIRANGMINSISGNADTNLSEKQMKSLIRMQLDDMKGWEIESLAAEGDSSGKQWCYSYNAKPLYVTVPYESSLEEIRSKMKKILEGE